MGGLFPPRLPSAIGEGQPRMAEQEGKGRLSGRLSGRLRGHLNTLNIFWGNISPPRENWANF